MGGFRRFLSVFSLVSRVPVPLRFEPDFSRTDFWLPLVGLPAALAAIIGALLFRFLFRDPALAAIGALFFEYCCFNVFHLDGLLDSADALMGQASVERRLEILRDSRIGSYAFFLGFFALAASVAALAALLRVSLLAAIAALVAAPVAGRSAAVLVTRVSEPASSPGLGSLVVVGRLHRLAFGWALASLPLLAGAFLAGSPALWALAGAASLLASACSGTLVSRIYRRGVGGYTGDALGAAVVSGELLCLLAFLALLRFAPVGG